MIAIQCARRERRRFCCLRDVVRRLVERLLRREEVLRGVEERRRRPPPRDSAIVNTITPVDFFKSSIVFILEYSVSIDALSIGAKYISCVFVGLFGELSLSFFFTSSSVSFLLILMDISSPTYLPFSFIYWKSRLLSGKAGSFFLYMESITKNFKFSS